jgi:two-component system, chemotaxis family, response regulator Rcp1
MNPESPDRPLVILIVEDNPTDVLIAREGFLSAKMPNSLQVVDDGIAAVEFLHRRGEYADAPWPDLTLLDLNMPRMNRQEVLAEIKADDDLKDVPVVLTTSKSDEDISQACALHADCYVSKPVGFDEFTPVVQTIQDFWFSVLTLPPDPG